MMNLKPYLPWGVRLLKSVAFFSAMIGTVNCLLTLSSVPLVSALSSIGYGLFFAATFWIQAMLLDGYIKNNP